MKILALDIASTTGICVGSSGADPRAWSVSLGEGSQGRRLSQALKMTQGLIVHHKPDLVVGEAAIGGKNASAFLIKLFGCVEAVCWNRGVKFEAAHSGTVRKHFVGKALTTRDFPHLKSDKAKKAAIKDVVIRRCMAMGWDVDNDPDAADAAATWDWACATFCRSYQAKPVGGLF
ncbi:hypothetical protein VWY73_12465 [Phaeobacter sp. JH20_12]|uniref:hypothetical protein n=2 Tax=Phaeobacter TaxID=302485 RepID=UPI003A850207